jgi:hypothetical protein
LAISTSPLLVGAGLEAGREPRSHVVDQDVELAVAGDDRCHGPLAVGVERGVRDDLDRVTALLEDGRQRPLGVRVLDVEHRHPDSRPGQVLADRAADADRVVVRPAPSAADHQGDLPRQPACRRRSCFRHRVPTSAPREPLARDRSAAAR